MIAFLKQNRTQDLVEERALELVNDMLIQHEGRLKAIYNLGEFELYDFRRYRTQRLINANKYNIGYVAKQIGHSDWNMLGRYYGAQVR